METAGLEKKTGRQAERDYRQRRSDILRRLGQSAFLNGSQFAILWVNPSTSQTDVFASEALQPKLQQWLGTRVREEAQTLSRRLQDERAEKVRKGQEVLDAHAVFDVDGRVPASAIKDELLRTDEEDLAPKVASVEAQEKPPPALPQPPSPRRPATVPANPSVLETPYSVMFGAEGNFSLPMPPASPAKLHQQLSPRPSTAPSPSNAPSPHTAPSSRALPAHLVIDDSWVRHTFTPAELSQWYSERFAELWQKTEKLVCKAWIKVIQPAKHTKFQYQKGEESRPDWWPRDVRHKEPDHLSKAERVALLVHLLRTAPVSIEDLEMGSASVSAHIPPERVEILREIYRIAKEERRAKQESPDGTLTSLTVALPDTPFFKNPPEEATQSPAPDEPKQHNTRNRSRRSLASQNDGGSNRLESVEEQQTPRGSASPSAAPSLPRSQSAMDVRDLASSSAAPYPSVMATPARPSSAAPATNESPASAPPLARSQSFAGPVTSAGRSRNAMRQSGRGSVGEADLLAGGSLDGLNARNDVRVQATPSAAHRTSGRRIVTPSRGGQGSPLAPSVGGSAGMSRSLSASAVAAGTGGASGSATKRSAAKAASGIDDSVASPAMIKSRSRLSQQHFEQMGIGSSPSAQDAASKTRGGQSERRPRGSQSAHVVQQPQFEPMYEQQLPPGFQLHQHHQRQLAQAQAQAVAQAQAQAIAQAQQLQHPPQQIQLVAAHPVQRIPSHPQFQVPPGHVLVYAPHPPQGLPQPVAFGRQQSTSPLPALPQPPAHFTEPPQQQQHQQQLHPSHHRPHHLAPPQHSSHPSSHHGHTHGSTSPHPASTQVQVQVQVHAGPSPSYTLPQPPPQHVSSTHSPSLSHHPQQQPPPQHDQYVSRSPYLASGNGSGSNSSYPTPTTASYASPVFPGEAGPRGMPDPFVHSPSLGGGGGGGDPFAGTTGAGAEDWSAFLHSDPGSSGTPSSMHGLGLVAVDAQQQPRSAGGGLMFEEGYYGEDSEGAFGLGMELDQQGQGGYGYAGDVADGRKEEARRRYEDQMFGLSGGELSAGLV
ncbi:hypothetical protein RTG_03018 [Rhodotorula toruloides ATCC 204091]|uniref:Subtelomeric hrmA-associated cluster protein AFUB-079030/YDR124W-like helical bundle domain-containing protein n=1 Tax=Rhodotorula toruloides TaxID=5286 RepID=A0A0K3CI95_RHOTO|nr:hypothetical protein RTG_03018 [Rhodotorula toruloides ATCC 204091]KAK4329940.1 hypothetical protein RTBOTA2_005883 [Rhodotorula toruloides]PRQ72032.1 Protein of unknown function (DUF2841)-domain containing protein [Rhodotorula toruloides]